MDGALGRITNILRPLRKEGYGWQQAQCLAIRHVREVGYRVAVTICTSAYVQVTIEFVGPGQARVGIPACANSEKFARSDGELL